MLESELNLLANLRRLSRYSIGFGIFISVLVQSLGDFPMALQVALALIALAVGIPHGAVDHLITTPKLIGFRLMLFMAAYVGVVVIAIFCILSQNTIGFQVVVLMSAVHFGIGDEAFVREIDKREGSQKQFPKLVFALAAGFVPVVIPLVNGQSTEALNQVNPSLVNWLGPNASVVFGATVILAAVALILMALRRRWQEVLDLCLLAALAIFAPPLVAFAFYFGLWHAVRHTGRLTLELPSARARHDQGRSGAAFWTAFSAGLPALAITVLGALVLGWSQGFVLGQNILWFLLVVVWALTVPHMALTAKLDARALS